MEMDYQEWLGEKAAEKCVKNLKRHGFDAHYVSTGGDACKKILELVSDYETFGFGGSDTTRSIGLLEELTAKGKTIYDHWQKNLSKDEYLAIRHNQGRADCFFSSANAITVGGEIVNIDGAGNRVTAMTFGPKKVVIVAGTNKITPDLESALKRAREVAGVMRAKSLAKETPCAETGFCSDCNTPDRICNATLILHRRPSFIDITVILVNQALGF